jgi:hypothetical protein
VTADVLAIIADDRSGADLEEFERQTTRHVNEPGIKYLRPRHNHRGFGSSVSINLTNAKVAREKKPPAKTTAPVEAPPIDPPTIQKPPVVGRQVATYHDFVDVCRDRADELKISREEIDRISGLADGHAAHLLAKKFIKTFSPASLPLILDTLGLRLRVEEDPELTARTLKRRTQRVLSHVHYPREPSALPAPDPKP